MEKSILCNSAAALADKDIGRNEAAREREGERELEKKYVQKVVTNEY